MSGGSFPEVSSPPSPHVPRPPCRAVTVTGDARISPRNTSHESAPTSGPLATGAQLPEDGWLDLGRHARLVVEDPRTTRETIFYGPATIRACVGHREESWLFQGVFESERGAGETPGAEEWLVTPDAVIRYGAAKLRVDLASDKTHPGAKTDVDVQNGLAFVWLSEGASLSVVAHAPAPRSAAKDSADQGGSAEADADAGTLSAATAADPWQRVESLRVAIVAKDAPSSVDAARASVDQCSSIAQHSEDLTRALLVPEGADAGAGQAQGAALIADQVSTRRLARAACAVAAVRVEGLGPGGVPALGKASVRSELAERLRQAEDAWTALPVTRY